MDPVTELLTSYAELNSSHITELSEQPSALEFMRFVSLNRPFVVRGGVDDWKAKKLWSKDYLTSTMKDRIVNVAITPNGNADAPVHHDGKTVFAKPLEEDKSFQDFIEYIARQELEGLSGEVLYAQTQNDNLRGEYVSLFSHVEKDIPWARIALQTLPEAINLWIGNSRSVSAMHKDNYENIYCQIIGEKHFTLLPPVAYACVGELDLSPASYIRENGLLRIKNEEGDLVPFPTWDPDDTEMSTRYSQLAKPMRVTLQPGDMMYLPALWYHKVSQSCSEEGLCCAVNYWYDMSFEGSFFSACSFLRNVVSSTVKIP